MIYRGEKCDVNYDYTLWRIRLLKPKLICWYKRFSIYNAAELGVTIGAIGATRHRKAGITYIRDGVILHPEAQANFLPFTKLHKFPGLLGGSVIRALRRHNISKAHTACPDRIWRREKQEPGLAAQATISYFTRKSLPTCGVIHSKAQLARVVRHLK